MQQQSLQLPPKTRLTSSASALCFVTGQGRRVCSRQASLDLVLFSPKSSDTRGTCGTRNLVLDRKYRDIANWYLSILLSRSISLCRGRRQDTSFDADLHGTPKCLSSKLGVCLTRIHHLPAVSDSATSLPAGTDRRWSHIKIRGIRPSSNPWFPPTGAKMEGSDQERGTPTTWRHARESVGKAWWSWRQDQNPNKLRTGISIARRHRRPSRPNGPHPEPQA